MTRAERIVDELLEAMSRRGFLGWLGKGAAALAVAPAALAAAPAAPAAAAAAAAPGWTGPYPPLRKFSGIAQHGMQDPNLRRWQSAYDTAHEKFYRYHLPQHNGVLYGVKGAAETSAAFHRDSEALKHTIMNPTPEWEQWLRANVPDWTAEPKAQKAKAQPQQQKIQPQPQQAVRPANRKAKRVWPERQQMGRDEERFDEIPESVYNTTMRAEDVVNQMLEADYDAHIKAHERVQKWDKAHGTYQELAQKKAEAAKLFQQLGRSISYERALVGDARTSTATTVVPSRKNRRNAQTAANLW